MRSGVGNIDSRSRNIGDLIIITANPNVMDLIIREVADCKGVHDLILALRKNVLNRLDNKIDK
jgi:hypothetical protein